jgi:tetratricopeptide (TPR) repeat protein
MGQAADFFVSYTSADRPWAEWIAWQLEAEGYQVVVQAWDFGPGRDWVHEMQQATATAKRVVAVLSAAYFESGHGEAEWRGFYADDSSGEQGRLLPVRVDKVKPLGLLMTRVYVDLVNQDAASARAALLAAARGARGKPADEPDFPGRREVPSATEQPRFPGQLPPVWNVPVHPNPFFTGRQLLLAEMRTTLSASEAASRRLALTGLGGVGKSQLAAEYAYRQRADYDLVWWVRGEQPTSLLSDYAALAGQPPLVADLGLLQDVPHETLVAAVRTWLEHHQRWLLVLDNVEKPQAVAELLPRGPAGHVLVTSRAEPGWEPLANPLPVDVLALTDATNFLLARTKERGPQVQAAATTLATTLGSLPLALEQAAAYIAASGTVTLASYAELFATRTSELLKRGQPVGYERTVATTWSLALQTLQQDQPTAVGLLSLAAFLGPDDLPQPLLATHHDQLPESLGATAGDPLALADAVAALRRYSLVRVVADGLFVHRLLQAVVRADMKPDAEREWSAAAVRLLRAGFPDRSDVIATWPECQRLLPHALVAARHGRRLEVGGEEGLWLLHQAALYLGSRGQYRQALTLNEQVLTGRRRLLGDDHPQTLASMNNLAETRRELGDLQGARDLHEQTLAARRRMLGNDHPDTLTSMNNLGATRRKLGDLRGARDLLENTLAARRRVLGNDHPDTLTTMNRLAVTHRALGDLEGARVLHEQSLAARRRVLGNDDLETLQSMTNLAGTYRSLGDLQAARDLVERSLAGFRKTLGDDHPTTLWSMNGLAEIRRDLGDFQGARELHEQILATRRRVLGDDHPQTLWSMSDLAATLRNLGDLHASLDLHEQTLAGRRRMLGDDHPHTLWSMNGLAEVRRTLGDVEGALQLHEQTLAGRRRVLGDDHPDTLTSMNNLAATRWTLGDLEGARDLFEQTLAASRRVLGDDHPDTLTSINNLAEIRRDLGDLEGARELHEQNLNTRRRVLGNDHPNTLTTMNNLAEIRRTLGDLEGALQLHEQTLAGRRRVLGDDHPETLWSMNNLAETHRALGDYQGASELHQKALDARRRVLGDDHPDTLTSMNNLAAVRRKLGDQ